MTINHGTKRIVVGAHYGLRDWLAQRVTAALMALFTLLVLGQVMLTTGDASQLLNDVDRPKSKPTPPASKSCRADRACRR